MKGDCFEAAGKFLLDRTSKDRILVHGEVTGQGPLEGVKFAHAWNEGIENGIEIVYDTSNGRVIKLPKWFYYSLGNIDPEKTVQYTYDEFAKMILVHQHWGPWDKYLWSLYD